MVSLLAWALNNWRPIVTLLAALTLYGYGYMRGNAALQAEWDSAVIRQHARNLTTNTEVSSAYQAKIAALRKRYDDLARMRSPGSVSISDSASRYDAAAPANGLSGDVGETIGLLMLQADLQTQQLIACQDWIKKQR